MKKPMHYTIVKINMKSKVLLILASLSIFGVAHCKDVLYFGDSQATLFMGNIIGSTFVNLPEQCRQIGLPVSRKKSWSFRGYATGSSSFHHWMDRSGPNKNHICGPKRHSVVLNERGKTKGGAFRQISPNLCQAGRSAIENAFQKDHKPELVVFQFMGNAAYRAIRVRGKRVIPSRDWGYDLPKRFRETKFDLTHDIQKTIAQIPNGVPCIFITTTPNRLKSSVRRQRRTAQAVIERAVLNNGRCGFVAGVTPETVEKFNNNRNFHGDSFHASVAGSRWFFDHHLPEICSEIRESL